MPITARDIKIINAVLLTDRPGTMIHETFKFVQAVMGTPFYVPSGSIHFDGVLAEGFSCYQVMYAVDSICVNGMVIVGNNSDLVSACLLHFTQQRDITHLPINLSKDIMN